MNVAWLAGRVLARRGAGWGRRARCLSYHLISTVPQASPAPKPLKRIRLPG